MLSIAPASAETSIPPPPIPAPAPIAHWTHTVALFAVLLLTTLAGRLRSLAPIEHAEPHYVRYFSSILIEWLLLGAVVAGIYRRGPFLLNAFRIRTGPDRTYSAPTAYVGGVAVYLLGLVAIVLVGVALLKTPLHNKTNEAVVLAMMPHRPLEYLAWAALSLTAGITEELISRGYLLQQITAWTQRSYLAIVLSALLFGSVHLYEGLAAILPLAALAIVYGLVVRAMKGDLRSVIVAHTLQDALVPVILLVHNHLLRFQQLHHS